MPRPGMNSRSATSSSLKRAPHTTRFSAFGSCQAGDSIPSRTGESSQPLLDSPLRQQKPPPGWKGQRGGSILPHCARPFREGRRTEGGGVSGFCQSTRLWQLPLRDSAGLQPDFLALSPRTGGAPPSSLKDVKQPERSSRQHRRPQSTLFILPQNRQKASVGCIRPARSAGSRARNASGPSPRSPASRQTWRGDRSAPLPGQTRRRSTTSGRLA